jgi:hypothetical protein
MPICLGFVKHKVCNDAELRAWLGDEQTIDPLSQAPVGSIVTKEDPKCRFMYVHIFYTLARRTT